VVYIHGHVSPGRKEAIEKYGAIVIRVDGEYEASIARAREDARIAIKLYPYVAMCCASHS